MNSAASLDERYLEFRDRTAPVFAAHPQLEPMRQLIFRQLLESGSGADWRDEIKHRVRPLRRRAGSRGPLVRCDVLVWIETPREVVVEALLPVVEELKRRGVAMQVVSHGAGDFGPQAFYCAPPARSASPRWTGAAWDALTQAVPALQSPSLRRAFAHAAAQTQSMMDETRRVLDAASPKLALTATTTMLPGGASLAVEARARKVPTLLLQHGITQAFYTPHLADRMATWGASSDDTLTGLGVASDTLLPLGSPRHDNVRASDGAARETARANLRRARDLPNLPTLVFFSNGNDLVRNGNAPVECAQWLEAVAREMKNDLNLVVRLHPNEDGSLYRESPHLKITKNELGLNHTLDGCDAVGSLCSTVLYEALLFRKPVWQFFADGWPELADNWKHGLARRVESCEALRACCAALSQGANADVAPPEIVESVFANHGHAAQAIADEIERQLRSPSD